MRRDLHRHPDKYTIDHNGSVYNKNTGNKLKITHKDGDEVVTLRPVGKEKYKIRVARLLAETFVDNPHNYKYAKRVCESAPLSADNVMWTNATIKRRITKEKERFGYLTVVRDLGKVKGEYTSYCKCICGKELKVKNTLLFTNRKTDCGCKYNEILPLNIKRVNNRILKEEDNIRYIIEEVRSYRNNRGEIRRHIRHKCRNCGEESECSYRYFYREKRFNCKCIKEKRKNKTLHPLYRKFMGMKNRCYNENSPCYKNYGGRGIKIDDDWLNNYESFYNWAIDNGWKYNLTIDRIDNDKNYSPENCRFIDIATQNRNKRGVKMDWDKVDYVRNSDKSVKELSDKFDVSKSTIQGILLNKNWVN